MHKAIRLTSELQDWPVEELLVGGEQVVVPAGGGCGGGEQVVELTPAVPVTRWDCKDCGPACRAADRGQGPGPFPAPAHSIHYV